jgi:hypothetical protein
MNKFLPIVVAILGFAGVSLGKEFTMPDEKPFASVSIPDEWKPEAYDNGVEATSDDGGIYIAIESVTGKSLDESIDEAVKFLEKQGVKVDEKSAETKESKLKDMDVVYTKWSGKDEDGPCHVTLSIVAIAKGKGLLVIYWASPEAEKGEENNKTLDEIVDSITAL